MKKTFPIFLFFQWVLLLQAQNFYPLGAGLSNQGSINNISADPDGQHIFLQGNFNSADGQTANGMLFLNNGVSEIIPFNKNPYSLFASAVHGKEVYAALIYDGNERFEIWHWDGLQWSVIGPGMPTAQRIAAMIWFENRLWLGGTLQRIGNTMVSPLCNWDGSTWAPETADA
jgi:hypothetical protein